jgi:hypothetical protein
MISTPASLRSEHWMLSSGIGGAFRLESLEDFAGIRKVRISGAKIHLRKCRTQSAIGGLLRCPLKITREPSVILINWSAMKIKAEGKTEFERFNNGMKKLLSVSHEEMQRRLAADPRGHAKPKRKRKGQNSSGPFKR